MARLLVAADLSSLAQRGLAERLADRARADGHEAVVVSDAPLTACKEADAAVCLLDGPQPAGLPIAVAATAHALGLPTLGLHTQALPDSLASLFTQAAAVTREADLAAALPAFYAQVRPFAGKLVRDQVPRLVREAGHHVQFREAAPEERVRYLKRKVADEAQELLAADPGDEKEEVADLLEALETLLRVRGVDRDDLRRVKESKRKRRGGFERFLVVESASQVPATAPGQPSATAWPAAAATRSTPAPAASAQDDAAEAAFQLPDPFAGLDPTEPEAAPAPSPAAPDVAIPSWMDAPEEPAAPLPPPPAPASQGSGGLSFEYEVTREPAAPQRTYEAPAPVFQPPAIPSFRIQQPPPAPHNRARLWNLGARGEKQEIPEVAEDPDRIEPSVRDV